MLRGEIYFVDLDPVQGREQAGTRPVLVDLDRRRGLAAEDVAPARREDEDIRPAGNEALGLHGFRVTDHVHHRGRAALGDRAEALLVNRREATLLVADGGPEGGGGGRGDSDSRQL